MTLPVFNLAQVIQEYNNKKRTEYSLNESFGYDYLKPEILVMTNDAIQAINEGHHLYCWTEDDKSHLEYRRRLFAENLAFLKKKNKSKSTLSTASPGFMQGVKTINEKLKIFAWMEQERGHLEQVETWEVWQRLPETFDKPYVEQLRKEWQPHGFFSCFNNQAITHIAVELLPALQQHHENASGYLFFAYFKLPPEIFSVYKKYLGNFSKAVSEFQEQLAESMYARLKAYDKSQLTNSNVLVYLYQELKKTGAVGSATRVPPATDSIDAEQFVQFHQYIEQYGSADLKARMRALSWFGENDFPLQYVVNDVGPMLIPKALVNGASPRFTWPKAIFKGANIRRNFFKDKFLLLVEMSKKIVVEEVTITMGHIGNVRDIFGKVKQKEEQINAELQELDEKYKTLSGFLYSSTRAFINTWKNSLVSVRYKLVLDKIILAEKLFEEINTSYGDSLSSAILPWQECNELRAIIDNVRANLVLYKECNALKPRLEKLENAATAILATNKAYQIVKVLADRNLPMREEVEYLFNFYRNTRCYDRNEGNSFSVACRPYLEVALHQLVFALKQNPYHPDGKSTSQHIDEILCISAVLKNIGDEDLKHELQEILQKGLKKYFLKYLEGMVRYGQNNEKIMETSYIELMLTTLGATVFYAGKSLAEHVTELQRMRGKSHDTAAVVRGLLLAETLATSYLEARFSKDLKIFDDHVRSFLMTDPELCYDQQTIDELWTIKKTLVTGQASLLGAGLVGLPKHQQALVGVDNEKTKVVGDLIEAVAYSEGMQEKVRDRNLSLPQKMALITALGASLQKALSKNQKTAKCGDILISKPGGRALFSKCYLEPSLIADEGRYVVSQNN